MATFESALYDRHNATSTPSQRYPYKRLDPSVQKFTKVLEIDLNRLRHHKANIVKYHASKQWQLLTKEQINSSRTVKKIKSTMKQLEQTRAQVVPEDVEKFDDNVEDIREKAGAAVAQFLDLHSASSEASLDPLVDVERTCRSLPQNVGSEHSGSPRASLDLNEDTAATVSGHSLPTIPVQRSSETTEHGQLQLQLHGPESDDPDAKQAEQSWQDLKNNLVELNSLIHVYHSAVHSQQEMVNTIEDNVETAQQNVEHGVLNLATAAKLKTAVFPVAGAVLGTIVGGPVGLVAGLKLGGLAAVGGSIAGFSGGHMLKKHHEKSTENHLQELSSNQAPEVVTETETSSLGATAAPTMTTDKEKLLDKKDLASGSEGEKESWISNKINTLFN